LKVYVVAEDGMATIGGSDMLIWTASHRFAAQDYRPSTSRSFDCTPYKLPVAIERATGDQEYQLPKDALTRLHSTLIRITIHYAAQWRRQQFFRITEWEELTTRSGRCKGVEFVVPAWFYEGVLDRVLVPVSRGGKRRSGTAHHQEREP
jgi:plasmid replication initiation protein